MKKLLSIAILLAAMHFGAMAQVLILNDNLLQGRLSHITTTVVDSLTNEPVAFASVYLIPAKDTTITNFTLTDTTGTAHLTEVPYGRYSFHVEMMGYQPVVKEKYFRDYRTDMGTIKLKLDEQFLKAARVTDVGNPIIIKQDTVEFNASSFRVGSNAMLKDLLKRMPGMEVTESGTVKFNGEAINKITVGGRTFFFNDQSTTLNNLPASVVDKIRVIDRESENTRATGVQDGRREKVLDVALKKEYEKGWFGNLGVKGGTTVAPKETEETLRDNRGLLYSGNALVSAYSEKDQVTLIANGQNINDSNTVLFLIEGADAGGTPDVGLSSAAQLGVNVNSSRIKDVEATVGANYKYTDTDRASRSERTIFQEDGDLTASSEKFSKGYANSLSANMEFTKEKGDVWFHIRPDFSFSKTDNTSSGNSETLREGAFVNRSENSSVSTDSSRDASIETDFTFRNLGGKNGRSLNFEIGGSYGTSDGSSSEHTFLETAAGGNTKDMDYISSGNSYSANGSVRYSEPIGEKWSVSATASINYSRSQSARDAFDSEGRNDYYSSVSRNNYLAQKYDISTQYKYSKKGWITLGAYVNGSLNETYSKNYGIEDTTGKGEWVWFVTPTLRFRQSLKNGSISAHVGGYSQQPSATRMRPVLNIENPSRLSMGNIYLKPSGITSFSVNWMRSDRKKFTHVMVGLTGGLRTNQVCTAQWYDADGIMYAIPVNTKTPGLSGNLSASYTTPLDEKKAWSFTVTSFLRYSSSVSYQAKNKLPGLDKDSFIYSDFMSEFWGDDSGDRFYSGASGFCESKTRTFSPLIIANLKYTNDNFNFLAGVNSSGNISRYSLDPSINMNTLSTSLSAEASYRTEHEFEFKSNIAYAFYLGYAEGYGKPEFLWNAGISKNIGAFNLSLSVNDILNQKHNLTHTVTDNYMEDSYRLVMGRYVLLGVKWNFGKMNSEHARRSQSAAWKMVIQ